VRKAIVIMSGGMDSAIACRLAVEKYGSNNVETLSFYYKQKQSIELEFAKINSEKMKVKNNIIDISFLGDIAKKVSANVIDGLHMPTITDILGDPAPATEVPNRNAILLMIAASFAQANDYDMIITGLQSQDEYSYWDTTENFVSQMNDVLQLNRKNKVQIFAPFQNKNKKEEIMMLYDIDGNIDLLETTITCYNPNALNESCGTCPSCSERIMNFAKAGFIDNIKYSKSIDWDSLFDRVLNK
jgi:7-cyano-7-deazaguanine synthase